MPCVTNQRVVWLIRFRSRLLCESSVDIVVDLGDFVRRMDNDGRGFALFDTREACHNEIKLLASHRNVLCGRGVILVLKICSGMTHACSLCTVALRLIARAAGSIARLVIRLRLLRFVGYQ